MKALVLCAYDLACSTRVRVQYAIDGGMWKTASKISIREFDREIRYILGSQACYFSATTLRYGQSAADNNVWADE